MQKNLNKQYGNGNIADVSGNEALRVAVDFAEWITGNDYKMSIDGNDYIWENRSYLDDKKYTTKELYKKFKSETAKATDR